MKKLVLASVIGGFVLAGCKQAPSEEPESERQVDILFTVKSSTASSLKSTAGTPEENAIDEITLYGVDFSGNVVKTFPDIYITSTGDTTLFLSNRIVSLYAIANSTADMTSQPQATVAHLAAMTCNYTLAPESPFVMSGIGAVTPGTPNTATIDLVRAIAKITVTGDGGFVVDSIKVKNTPDEGFVLAQSSFAVPTSARVDYELIESAICYVPENTTSDPTTLTVWGTYDSNPIPVEVEFIVSGTLVPVERNKWYSVTIAPSPTQECIITITIQDWDDVDVDTHYFEY